MSVVLSAVRAAPHLRATLALFAGVALVYLFTGNYVELLSTSDALYTAAPAWKLGQFQTLNIDDFPQYGKWFVEVDGHVRSDRFPGAIVVAMPFYAVGGAAAFGIDPGVWSAAVVTACAVAVMHRVLLTLVSPVVALGGALVLAFGTSAWSVAGHSVWTHGPTMLGLALAMWAMTRRSHFLAGLGFGFAILGRPHTAVVAATVGVWESVVTRSVRPAAKVAAGSFVGVALLLLWNRVNAGTWALLVGTYDNRGSVAVSGGASGQAKGNLWLIDLASTFGSPLRGLLVLSPFLLILLPGVLAAWRVAPAWVRSSAVGGLVYLALQLAGNTWTGGYGYFGYRLALEPLLLATPLLALCWQEWVAKAQWRRWTFGVLAAASVWWFALASKSFPLDPLRDYAWSDWDVEITARAATPLALVMSTLFVVALAWILRRYAAEVPDDRTEIASRAGNPPRKRATRR